MWRWMRSLGEQRIDTRLAAETGRRLREFLNVIDLHQRRETLKAHGVPIRRGVLLHGPPGTGKSFACRYLCAKPSATTRILVASAAWVAHERRPLRFNLLEVDGVGAQWSVFTGMW